MVGGRSHRGRKGVSLRHSPLALACRGWPESIIASGKVTAQPYLAISSTSLSHILLFKTFRDAYDFLSAVCRNPTLDGNLTLTRVAQAQQIASHTNVVVFAVMTAWQKQ